jgi:hypothetical protein
MPFRSSQTPVDRVVDHVEVWLPGGRPLVLKLFKPDYFLPDEFSEPPSRQEELSYTDLLQVDRLESLYGRWLRAKSINARSAAMHRAVLEIQPRIAEVWIPARRSRRGDCGRRRFRDTLQMISMLRQRGFDHLAFNCMGLITNLEGQVSEGDTPVPRAAPRRCEGRSRAPAAAGGGSRRGGSRRGGGDRGDDSGGDEGSDSGGDGLGGPSPEPRFWSYLKRVAIVATILGALYAPVWNLIAKPSKGHRIEKEVIVKERLIPRDAGLRRSAPCGSRGVKSR